ncbi:uncharacterized protein LOC122053140 [Zingiber officinale]|uniref:Uncharacterized protein n=1 Tax=Zingiber officinale TaxID=94328 RepID=A0A8J5HAB0_ZINOF|nr:uncharacterized protein LOC122053140 [Zingiber officinale]KAG6522727.1 hypothetical protein ZIOFF_019878 [Zingiber officinale]
MAYRRKQPAARVSTVEETRSPSESTSPASETPASLAARAIRASAAHRDASSLSSAYGESAVSSPRAEAHRMRPSPPSQRDIASYEYTSMKSLNESKYGFWGTLARKAKSIIDNDDDNFQMFDNGSHQAAARSNNNQGPGISKKTETTHKLSDTIGSSLNQIGGTIKNAVEEGLTMVESKISHETRKLNIRRKGNAASVQGQAAESMGQQHMPRIQTDYEVQLKASRDVANAMAAKTKLLLRELKTVKADLAFAKERCAQLEENRVLRENYEEGDGPEEDDLIRLQLETLLAEKARLANENSVYARENRFLREIVEYHQLTMQDVVYIDEGIEEVSEVYTIPTTPCTPPAVSEANNIFVSNPLAPSRTNSSPATLQPSLMHSPSIIKPEDCPIIPAPPVLPRPTDPAK